MSADLLSSQIEKRLLKTCFDWSKYSWKFGFVVSELVVGSGEQNTCLLRNGPHVKSAFTALKSCLVGTFGFTK